MRFKIRRNHRWKAREVSKTREEAKLKQVYHG